VRPAHGRPPVHGLPHRDRHLAAGVPGGGAGVKTGIPGSPGSFHILVEAGPVVCCYVPPHARVRGRPATCLSSATNLDRSVEITGARKPLTIGSDSSCSTDVITGAAAAFVLDQTVEMIEGVPGTQAQSGVTKCWKRRRSHAHS